MKSEPPFTSIGIGEIGTIKERGSLAIYGLGSCIGLILFNEMEKIAGLAHILLPGPRLPSDETKELPAKYGNEAIDSLLLALGVEKNATHRLSAGIVGGATIFSIGEDSTNSIGDRNVEEIRKWLMKARIKIVWEETGGICGRSLIFSLPESILKVRTLKEGWRIIERK